MPKKPQHWVDFKEIKDKVSITLAVTTFPPTSTKSYSERNEKAYCQ